MKVEAGTVTIVRITDVMTPHRLDPIRVTLDDIERGKGRINIECWGKAWASYWGGMGDKTIAEFFVSCHNDYLIGNLAPGLPEERFSNDALQALCKKTIRGRRKRTGTIAHEFGTLSKEDAADLMRRVEDLSCDHESDVYAKHALMDAIFGTDGVFMAAQAKELNPEYEYLGRICDAVREALKTLPAPASREAVAC